VHLNQSHDARDYRRGTTRAGGDFAFL
jgi:hypothetical protein